jgi:hypothetical protein
MDEKKPDVKEAIAELMDNLGAIGVFMLGEVRAFLRKSWGTSREEFMQAVDKTARTMKQSGKMAAEDIERAASQIKESWSVLNQERNLEWDSFLGELTSRLSTLSDVSRDTFDLCVNQARDAVIKQWIAMGRLGEDQLKTVQNITEMMAKSFKGQWGSFRDTLEKTGKKVDRAMEAALRELRKKGE